MKKQYIFLIAGILLIGIASAITIFDFIKIGEKTEISIYEVCLKQAEFNLVNLNFCNAFKNKYLDTSTTSLKLDLLSDEKSQIIKISNSG